MLERCIGEFDAALRAVFAPARSVRPVPGDDLPEVCLSAGERQHTAALMRINHVGEICAQALYQGQALSCKDAHIRDSLKQAAAEETEHLAWTEARINELGGRKSLLNPLWYGGALAIGVLAGRVGNAFNLGFLAETERQVEAHLNDHLQRLNPEDKKSVAILQQMRDDEIQHAQTAIRLGASELPQPVKWAMRLASKLMTRTAYHL